MLTPRGWWMLLLTLVVGTIGAVMALRGSAALLLVCVAVAIWYTWEWAVFCHRARITCRQLRVQRLGTVAAEQDVIQKSYRFRHGPRFL